MFLSNENDEIINYLKNIGVNKIFKDGNDSIENIINEIDKNSLSTESLSIEIEKLKKIIEENNCNKEIDDNSNKKIKMNLKNKVISISGNYGVGKSIITALLGKTCQKLNGKVLIIDFDIINSSINTLFRINRHSDLKTLKVDSYITNISKNLDVLCGISEMFTDENKIDYEKVNDLLSKLKLKYDVIFVDTSSETYLKYTRTILSNSDVILFIVEPNILEIKKAQALLEIYIEDWDIISSKFKILFNKCNNNSIDKEVLKKIFERFEIIDSIMFSDKYTLISNNLNANSISLKNYMKIINKIDKGEKNEFI